MIPSSARGSSTSAGQIHMQQRIRHDGAAEDSEALHRTNQLHRAQAPWPRCLSRCPATKMNVRDWLAPRQDQNEVITFTGCASPHR
jgi:hypothetical protein